MTDLVRRSLDTLFGMQQELLTSTSRQTLQWLESEKSGKSRRATQLVEFAREGVETFARAQKKLLDVAAQESAKATSGKMEGDRKPAKKTEVAQLAREAGNAFIEAQKRILDVMGQQMNVNLDATTRAMKIVSPFRLMPIATRTGEGVKSFMQKETSLIESLIKPSKIKPPKKIVRHGRVRAVRPHKVVPA